MFICIALVIPLTARWFWRGSGIDRIFQAIQKVSPLRRMNRTAFATFGLILYPAHFVRPCVQQSLSRKGRYALLLRIAQRTGAHGGRSCTSTIT